MRDLRVDCSAHVFLYSRNGVVAGLSSDSEIVAICITSVSTSDVICMGGDVLSATAFGLSIANLNGGPFVPLGAGSGGSISSSGQSLSFTTFVDGDRFDFTGLGYSSRSVLGAAATDAAAGAVTDLTTATVEAIRAGAVEAAQASGADTASTSSVIAEALDQLSN